MVVQTHRIPEKITLKPNKSKQLQGLEADFSDQRSGVCWPTYGSPITWVVPDCSFCFGPETEIPTD